MNHDKHATRYISKLANKLRRKLDAFSNGEPFSGTQGRVLHFLLMQDGNVFQKDIEEEYSLRPPSASALLKSMEEHGLIYREPLKEDARLKRIVLTDKAHSYNKQVIEDIYGLEAELTKGISSKELEIFMDVAERMMKNIS